MRIRQDYVIIICAILIVLSIFLVTGTMHQISNLAEIQLSFLHKQKPLDVTSLNVSIGIIRPTFTAAAYNNAFYTFYGLKSCILGFQCPRSDHLNLLTGKIPVQETPTIKIATVQGQLRQYLQTEVVKIYPRIKEMFPKWNVHIITDADVNDAPSAKLLNKTYNIIILGHQEYVTQKEYDNLREFVAQGGTLICLDGNIFYAQVRYNPVNQTVTLVNGHGFGFNGKYAYPGLGERWENETANWLGSNFFSLPYVLVNPQNKFYRVPLVYSNNPFNYREHEEQYVTSSNIKIIMNYGARWDVPRGADRSTAPLGYLTQPPTIATYEKPYGNGRVIVLGIYADEVLSNREFLKFFDSILLGYANRTSSTQYQANNSALSLSISQNRDSMIAASAFRKGLALAAAGYMQDAFKFYEKALATGSNNTGLFYNTGRALSVLGNYNEALVYYDKALAEGQLNNATTIYLLLAKGDILLKLGSYKDALNTYDTALTKAPKSISAREGEVAALINLNDSPKVSAHLTISNNTAYKEFISRGVILAENRDFK